MNNLVKKAGLGVVLAATTLTAVAPADAQRWRRYDRGGRGGDVAAGALLGGIVGLGIGAAIASNNRDRYYDRGYRGYYDRGYYYGPGPRFRGYYAPPPRRFYRGVPRGYYGDPYYGGPVYRGGYYGDPYYGW